MDNKERRQVRVDCSICRQPGVIALFVLLITCSHVFHRHCLYRLDRDRSGQPRCPVCRAPFSLQRDLRPLRFTEVYYASDEEVQSGDEQRTRAALASTLDAARATAASFNSPAAPDDVSASATASNSAVGTSSTALGDASASAAASHAAVGASSSSSSSSGDSLVNGLGFSIDPAVDNDQRDGDLPSSAGVSVRRRSIPASLPELEDRLAAVCVPREHPNRITGLGHFVRPSDIRRSLFHLMNTNRISPSMSISDVYLRAAMAGPEAAEARRDGTAGPAADEDAARLAGRETLEADRMEMAGWVMSIELDSMFARLDSYENYHHELEALYWDVIGQFNASNRLLQDAYVQDIRSARRFFQDHHPMHVQEDHDFVMTRSGVDQMVAALGDALERGPGYEVRVDVLGSRADGQRRGGQSLRRYHYAQTAPAETEAVEPAAVRITSVPAGGRGRRLGRGANRAASGQVLQRSPSSSAQAGGRFRRGSSTRRGAAAGGRNGMSRGVFDDSRRAGGNFQHAPRPSSSPSVVGVRLASTDAVRPRNLPSSPHVGSTASRGGRRQRQNQRRLSTSGGEPSASLEVRQLAQRRPANQQAGQRRNLPSGRRDGVAQRGDARGATARDATTRQHVSLGDPAMGAPLPPRRSCALRRAAELRELLTGVDNFDIEEEVRRRERVVRRPDPGVETAVRFTDAIRQGIVGRLNRIREAGWLSCDDAREAARQRMSAREDAAAAAIAARTEATTAEASTSGGAAPSSTVDDDPLPDSTSHEIDADGGEVGADGGIDEDAVHSDVDDDDGRYDAIHGDVDDDDGRYDEDDDDVQDDGDGGDMAVPESDNDSD